MVGKVNFDQRFHVFLGFPALGALTLKQSNCGGEGRNVPRGVGPSHSPFTPSRKLKKEFPSFQSIQAKREDLYLVTETLKTKRVTP